MRSNCIHARAHLLLRHLPVTVMPIDSSHTCASARDAWQVIGDELMNRWSGWGMCALVLLSCGIAQADREVSADATLRRLASADAADRVAAVREMRTVSADHRFAEPLVLALEDPSAEVRREAANTLALKGNQLDYALCRSVQSGDDYSNIYDGPGSERWLGWQQSAADELGKAATDTDEKVRLAAVRALAELDESGSNVFVPCGRCASEDKWLLWIKVGAKLWQVAQRDPSLVIRLLDDRDPQVVVSAFSCVERTAKERVIPFARRFLRDRRPECRALAVSSLPSLLGDNSVIFPLLGDGDGRVRNLAVRMIESPDRILSELVPRYYSLRAPLRRSVMQLLGRQVERYPQVVEWGLNDPDAGARYIALQLCVEAQLPLDTDYLVRQLSHPSASVRELTVSAVAAKLGSEAEPLLLRMLYDSDGAVREAAVDRLGNQPTPDRLRAIVASFRHFKENDDVASEYALGRAGEIAQPLLDQMLTDRDWRIRALAVSAARWGDGSRRVATWKRYLFDPHPGVCVRAARLIDGDEMPAVRLDLSQRSRSDNLVTRINALAVLADIGDKPARKELQQMAESADAAASRAAKAALKVVMDGDVRVRT